MTQICFLKQKQIFKSETEIFLLKIEKNVQSSLEEFENWMSFLYYWKCAKCFALNFRSAVNDISFLQKKNN